MQNKYKETLALLAEKEAGLATTLLLIRNAQEILRHGEDQNIIFEVHIQQNMPNEKAIMTRGHDLADAVERARDLREQWMGKRGKRCEVFLRKEGLRIALSGEDVAAMLGNGEQASDFLFDNRVKESSRVFLFGQKLPSMWYASEVTPPKNAPVSV